MLPVLLKCRGQGSCVMHNEEEFDEHCDLFGFRIWILVIQLLFTSGILLSKTVCAFVNYFSPTSTAVMASGVPTRCA